jgi:hypothetical protein
MKIRYEAHRNLGSTSYAQSKELVLYKGGPKMAGGPEGKNKCNAFVFHKAGDAGATVPLTRGGSYIPGYYTSPPLAYDWWDSGYAISGWSRLNDSAFPQPGYVVSGPDNDAERYGHVGILDYDGGWIQAGAKTVNKYPHLETAQTKPYQPAGFRKYIATP